MTSWSWRKTGLVAALLLGLAACDDDKQGTIGGPCVTAEAFCQLTDGVTTKAQAQAILGKPFATQTSSGGGTTIEQWIYICMPDAQSAQQVQLLFDGNGVLEIHQAVSTGPNAPPPLTCI